MIQPPPVTHTKQAVYIDDNIVTDHDTDPDVIMQLKLIISVVLDWLRVETDLSDGPPKNRTRYLGLLVDLV